MTPRSYKAREVVLIQVSGDKVDALRQHLLMNQLGPEAWVCFGPDLLSAVFTPHRATQVIAWLIANGITDEDYAADLAAEAGA